MTAKTELPPLPERFDCTNGSAQWCYGCYTMTRDDLGDYVLAEDYDALRNVSEALQAEVEALRAEVERVTCELMDAITRADKLEEELREAREFRDKMANAIGNDQLRRFIEKHGEPVPLTIRMQEAEARAERLEAEVERLRRLVQERDTMLGKRLCAGTNADGKPRCLALAEEHARAERLAEALRKLEEREQSDEALLRQALEALELRCGTHADERKKLIPALRERLGEGGAMIYAKETGNE